jgi:mono/diheme cytochrome c family protein
MSHARTKTVGVASFLVAFGWAALAGQAAGEAQSPELKAHLAKLDAGAKTIDVSKYPDEQKAGYKLFAKKCSKCHTIARPINSDFVLPAQWERYIKRMMYKPNSQMNDQDGKTIYKFLVYDASVRKTEALRKALHELTDERAAAVDKIKAVNPSFTMP